MSPGREGGSRRRAAGGTRAVRVTGRTVRSLARAARTASRLPSSATPFPIRVAATRSSAPAAHSGPAATSTSSVVEQRAYHSEFHVTKKGQNHGTHEGPGVEELADEAVGDEAQLLAVAGGGADEGGGAGARSAGDADGPRRMASGLCDLFFQGHTAPDIASPWEEWKDEVWVCLPLLQLHPRAHTQHAARCAALHIKIVQGYKAACTQTQ